MTDYTRNNIISAETVSRLVVKQKMRDKRNQGIDVCGDCKMWCKEARTCWGKPQSESDTACKVFIKR
jgi:hypothetical protein